MKTKFVKFEVIAYTMSHMEEVCLARRIPKELLEVKKFLWLFPYKVITGFELSEKDKKYLYSVGNEASKDEKYHSVKLIGYELFSGDRGYWEESSIIENFTELKELGEFIDENFVEADFPKSEMNIALEKAVQSLKTMSPDKKLKLLFKSGALTEEQYIKALENL
jgi:hypothetical protein